MFPKLILFLFVASLPVYNCFNHRAFLVKETLYDIFDRDQGNEIDSNEIPKTSSIKSSSDVSDDPPPHQEYARMARYVMHHSDWCAMATISTRSPLEGKPFANVFSVSDGATLEESTGIPYFYLTNMEMSVKDLNVNNDASITMSLAQGNFCSKKNYDYQDPRCAHIIFSGKIVEVEPNSEEEKFASKALVSRHPAMTGWPHDHNWKYAKMLISNVLVLDFFGGANEITPEQYFSATPY